MSSDLPSYGEADKAAEAAASTSSPSINSSAQSYLVSVCANCEMITPDTPNMYCTNCGKYKKVKAREPRQPRETSSQPADWLPPAYQSPAAGGNPYSRSVNNDNARICRLCNGGADYRCQPTIAPCPQSGSYSCQRDERWVHRECLDTWRAVSPDPASFHTCDICKTPYQMEVIDGGEEKCSKALFTCFIFRDCFALFVLINLIIFALGFPVQAIFHADQSILSSFTVTNFISIHFGPGAAHFFIVYVCGGLFFFFALGCIAIVLYIMKSCGYGNTNNTYVAPSSYPYYGSSRYHNDCYFIYCYNGPYSGGYGGNCSGCDGCCYCCSDSHPYHHSHTYSNSGNCNCNGLNCNGCNCNGCSGGGGGGKDCGSALAVILIVIVVIIILIGVIFGIFLISMFVTNMIARHVHVLHRRVLTKTNIVRDLSRPTSVASNNSSPNLDEKSSLIGPNIA